MMHLMKYLYQANESAIQMLVDKILCFSDGQMVSDENYTHEFMNFKIRVVQLY